MRVLLRLGDVELGEPGLADHLGQHVPGLLLGEGDAQSQPGVVLGHAHQVHERRGRAPVEAP